MREHGIESYYIAKKYQLGVVIEPLPGDEGFTGMLSIPYLTKHGCRAIKFRRLTEYTAKGQEELLEGEILQRPVKHNGPKNLQHTGQSTRLYNTNSYFEAGAVIGLAEGEADAIAATEILGVPTLGIPGAEQWKANKRVWAPLFKNFPKVLVFTDGDKINPETGLRPGEELGKAIRESLTWRVKIVASPEGEDVCSMVAAGRQDELLKQFGDDEDE